MKLILQTIAYESLSAKQKESYNFQKVSAIMADFGFATIRLNDDWQGADFLAQHIDGQTILRVQLKGRATIQKKYQNKGLWICFREKDTWYLYPHDGVMDKILARTGVAQTESWRDKGGYSFPYLTDDLVDILREYRLKETKTATH